MCLGINKATVRERAVPELQFLRAESGSQGQRGRAGTACLFLRVQTGRYKPLASIALKVL